MALLRNITSYTIPLINYYIGCIMSCIMPSTIISSEVTSLVYCCLITRKDGYNIGITTSDGDITISGITYHASSGFKVSAIEKSDSLDDDNLQIDAILDSDLITESDLKNNKFDCAKIEIFLVDHLNQPSAEKHFLYKGSFGNTTIRNGQFSVNLKSINHRLNQNIGDLYSPLCRADFCDKKCGLNTLAFRNICNVVKVENDILIYVDKHFENSVLAFGKIAIEGVGEFEIKNNYTSCIELTLPLRDKLNKKNICTVSIGCDKSFSSCCDKFNNALNFRGEPHIKP